MHLLLTSSRRLCLEGIAPLETLSALFVSSSFSLLIPVLPSSILPCLSSRSFSPPQLKAEAEPPLYRSLPPPPLPVIMPCLSPLLSYRLSKDSHRPLLSDKEYVRYARAQRSCFRRHVGLLDSSLANAQIRLYGSDLNSDFRLRTSWTTNKDSILNCIPYKHEREETIKLLCSSSRKHVHLPIDRNTN